MSQITVAGMQIEGELNEGDAPLEALVCIKVVADDGGVDWKVMGTAGLHTVEALGAASFALEMMKRGALGDDD